MVKFTRDMRPYVKGEQAAVPDDLADKLIASGEATAVASVFDDQPPEAEATRDRRPARPGRRYQTR